MARGNLLRNPLVWILFAGIAVGGVVQALRREIPARSSGLGVVPAFSLVGADGSPFARDDVRGKVWIGSFFFTRCRSQCPALMSSLVEFEGRLRAGGDDVDLVSFSVDPEHDGPEQLRDYAATMGIDLNRWELVTGDLGAMRELILGGFQVPMGEREQLGDDLFDVAHSAKLVLVDRKGRIRGYYNADEAGMDELYARAHGLAAGR
jgi:protein SCO1/2